jgi:hypothetical protein
MQSLIMGSASIGYVVQRRWEPKVRLCARSLNDTRWHASLETGKQRFFVAVLTRELMGARSLSGKWMSAPQMAQEFAGLTQRKTLSTPAKTSNVNLFLPAQVLTPRHVAPCCCTDF